MILYRDHRGTLEESMKTLRKFKSTDEMLAWVQYNIFNVTGVVCEVTLDPDRFSDNRIGWNNIHHVLAGGCVVGMCNLEEE